MKKKIVIEILAGALLLMFIGCSDDSGSGDTDTIGDSTDSMDADTQTEAPAVNPVGSCIAQQQGVEVCLAATGKSWTEAKAEVHCTEDVPGVYNSESCSQTDCEGMCDNSQDHEPGYETVIFLYTAGNIDMGFICTSVIGGKWYPGCDQL
ncbi:MAG: hypothetical protein JXR91_04700 [Deltaproteobacteria bacterium]|nr:hypothetical protein [Deltaproteobacteria bacterium]